MYFSLRQHRAAYRRGLTLMELVVVMSVLIALAAIIVPLLPGLLGRAERSSRATNSQEIYKAVQLFESMYSHYPTDWDALGDGSATPCNWLDGTDGVHGNIGLKTGGPLQLSTLTAAQVSALTGAGINRVQLFSTTAPTTNSGQDVTFNPYSSLTDRSTAGSGQAISTTSNLVILTSLGQFQLNLSDNASTSTGTYVVFGLGKRTSLIGVGMNEAPVNFFDNAALSPDSRYSRYGVVFQVSGVSATNASAGATGPIIDFAHAKFVRVIRFGGTLGVGDDAIRDFWKDVAGGDGS
ncbi:MAG TPA: type II secretion system protein [Gemmataceae bacterium]|nr:type II secretion system protein [Gemmataceae bacterium]